MWAEGSSIRLRSNEPSPWIAREVTIVPARKDCGEVVQPVKPYSVHAIVRSGVTKRRALFREPFRVHRHQRLRDGDRGDPAPSPVERARAEGSTVGCGIASRERAAVLLV
jgi:hypothetical protein